MLKPRICSDSVGY